MYRAVVREIAEKHFVVYVDELKETLEVARGQIERRVSLPWRPATSRTTSSSSVAGSAGAKSTRRTSASAEAC